MTALEEFKKRFPSKYVLRPVRELPQNILNDRVSKEDLIAYFRKPRVVSFLTKGATLRVYLHNRMEENHYGLTLNLKEVREAIAEYPADTLTGKEVVEVVETVVLHLLEKKYANLLSVYAILPVHYTRVIKPTDRR